MSLGHGTYPEVRRKNSLFALRVASVLFVFFLIVLLFISFEFYARWHYRNVLSTSHGRDYFYYKSYPLFHAEKNNIRFRGKDIHARTENTYRIVVLGDSLAWGQGVYPYSSRFPELTEKLFEERYPETDIEVINLGVPGSNLNEHIHFLPFVLLFDPDFVLYQWYVNDMEKFVNILAFQTVTLIPNFKWHTYCMNHCVTYILLFRAWNQLRTSLGLQQSYTRYLVDKLHDPKCKSSICAQMALHKLISTIQKKGVAAGIVLFPQCRSKMSQYELAFLHERVLQECDRDNIPCLDLREAFSAFDGNMQVLRASSLDGHPSKTAHRIAAEQIVNTFGPVWKEALDNHFLKGK